MLPSANSVLTNQRERAVLLGELRAHAHDLAAQELREVDEVAGVAEQVVAAAVGLRVALGPDRRAARVDQRLQRVGHLVAVGRVAVPGAHREHVAHLPGDEVAGVGDVGVEPAHRADLEHEPGRLDGGGERLALLDGDAHRLLDQHVLAGLDRLLRHRDVELVGDRDDHRVDERVGEHLVVVAVGHAAAGARPRPARAGPRRRRRGRTARRCAPCGWPPGARPGRSGRRPGPPRGGGVRSGRSSAHDRGRTALSAIAAPCGEVQRPNPGAIGSASMEPITIVIADDHALVRSGLRQLLEAEGDMTVVGEAGNADAALELARACGPRVLLLDLSMPGTPSLEAIPGFVAPLARPGGGGADRARRGRVRARGAGGRGERVRAQGRGRDERRRGDPRGRRGPAVPRPRDGGQVRDRVAARPRRRPPSRPGSSRSAPRSPGTGSRGSPAAAGWASSTGRSTSRSIAASRSS